MFLLLGLAIRMLRLRLYAQKIKVIKRKLFLNPRNDFITIGDLGFSPFAGLNLLNTDPKTFWGLNLGLFTDFELDTGRVLYLEPKYTLGKSDRFTLSVGVSF